MNVSLSVEPLKNTTHTTQHIDRYEAGKSRPERSETHIESVHSIDNILCNYPVDQQDVCLVLVLQLYPVLNRIYCQQEQLVHYPKNTFLFVYT